MSENAARITRIFLVSAVATRSLGDSPIPLCARGAGSFLDAICEAKLLGEINACGAENAVVVNKACESSRETIMEQKSFFNAITVASSFQFKKPCMAVLPF